MSSKGYDVCVVGLGPTGRGLAYRCAQSGLSVVAIDPRPDRTWVPTYAAWTDELPDWLPRSVISAEVQRPEVWTNRQHITSRPYAVLSKSALREHLSLDAVRVIAARAASLGPHTVTTDTGETVRATLVVDARGLPAVGRRQSATAHGIFVDAARCKDFLAEDQALLLDWRDENSATNAEPPSFLYAVPIGDGRILFEEINIGLRGGLTQRELRQRTLARLKRHGVRLAGDEEHEAARYVLDESPPHRRDFGRVPVRFGSRGGMMHPCTGYSVVNSLARTDEFVAAVTNGRNPIAEVWTPQARLVYWMRMRGLAGLGRLTYEQCKSLFDSFFARPVESQIALLSAHDEAVRLGTVLFSTVAHTWPFRWRYDLVGWSHRHRWDNWSDVATEYNETEYATAGNNDGGGASDG